MVTKEKGLGQAWLILVVSYTGIFINSVMHLTNGVFYIEYLKKFGESETKTSIVGALNIGLFSLAAPLGSMIAKKYNSRVSIITGGILSATGYFSSAFVSSLNWMIITQGLIVGTGFGLSTTGYFCALGFYFDAWRDMVLSIVYIIMGTAGIAAAPFGLYLLHTLGITRAIAVLGSIQANVCVFGMICKPSSSERRLLASIKSDSLNKRTNKCIKQISGIFDIKLLRSIPFACYMFSTISWNISFAVIIMHLPNYVSLLGGSKTDIGLQMMAFSIANVCGRLLGSLLIFKLLSKCLYFNTASLAIAGLMTSVFMFYSKLNGGLYVFTIQLGLLIGIPNAMVSVISIQLVGIRKLPEAYGFSFLFSGIGVVTGPVLCGYVYSLSHNYEHSFIVAGVILIIGFLLTGATALCKSRPVQDDVCSIEVDLPETKIQYLSTRESFYGESQSTIIDEPNTEIKL